MLCWIFYKYLYPIHRKQNLSFLNLQALGMCFVWVCIFSWIQQPKINPGRTFQYWSNVELDAPSGAMWWELICFLMTIEHGRVIRVEVWVITNIYIGSVVELPIRNAGVPGLMIPGPAILLYICSFLISYTRCNLWWYIA